MLTACRVLANWSMRWQRKKTGLKSIEMRSDVSTSRQKQKASSDSQEFCSGEASHWRRQISNFSYFAQRLFGCHCSISGLLQQDMTSNIFYQLPSICFNKDKKTFAFAVIITKQLLNKRFLMNIKSSDVAAELRFCPLLHIDRLKGSQTVESTPITLQPFTLSPVKLLCKYVTSRKWILVEINLPVSSALQASLKIHVNAREDSVLAS